MFFLVPALKLYFPSHHPALEDFTTSFPVPVIVPPESPSFLCTVLGIHDDNIPEVNEDLQMELRLVERDLADQVRIPRSRVTIRIRDNDATTGITQKPCTI